LPSLAYNFEPLKDNGVKLLKSYKLNIKILNLLRKEVAELATRIDPLEHWYYYIKRHPQFRKDLLKGDAALAQELYQIYDLLTTIVEVVTGKKAKPLFEFLYEDFGHPFLIPKVDYLHGEDVKALQFAIRQFKEWSEKRGNKSFVSNEAMEKLNAVEKKIKDYEQRYDDRSYAGSIRTIEAEEKIKLEDLDEDTKKWADTYEDKHNVSRAIMHRLGELQQELREIFWDISKQLQDKENEWWQKERNFHNYFWMANRKKLAKLPREEQLKLSRKEYDKIVKKAKEWKQRGEEFANSVSRYADLVFCKVCRKNPIQLHIENNNLNMWEVSRTKICDECIRTRSPATMPQGKWRCKYCGKLLYKFTHNNILYGMLLNTAPARVTLEYGRIKVVVKCQNRKCKKKNTKIINWGWMP